MGVNLWGDPPSPNATAGQGMVYGWICLMVAIIKYWPKARALLGMNDEEVFRRGKEER